MRLDGLARDGSRARVLAKVALVRSCILPQHATAKSLIDYFQPTPIACPLTSNTWGASSSIPRDTCNGLEDTKKPPQWIYWDGRILKSPDGKYHLLGSRWAGSAGHGGWYGSDAIHAVSESSPLGPYVDKGFAYTNGPDTANRSKGHNTSACQLPDGTYCLIVSETVPFTIFTASSLDGPWTNKGHAQIDTNGVQVVIPSPGDQHLESNVSLVVRPDGNFEIIQRHGIIALSTTGLLGPYKVQRVTTNYPAAETPPANLATIFPNRQQHLGSLAGQKPESTYVWAEDPLIWYSGGLYHVVYDYPNERIGYHLTSPDGIHDWEDRGLAYDPRMARQLWSCTDGSVVSWYKMERPSVIMENGHITHFNFSVTDVDKGQFTGGSNHGNKIILMAFDGVAFDAEMGGGGADGGVGGGGGASGSGGTDAGTSSTGGAGGRSGTGRADAGVSGAGGGSALGGVSGSGSTRLAGTGGNHGTASTGVGEGGSGWTLDQGGAGGSLAGGGSGSERCGGATGADGSRGVSIGSGAAAQAGGSPAGTSGTGGSGGQSGSRFTGGARTANGSSGCSCAHAGARGTGHAVTLMVMIALAWLLALARARTRHLHHDMAQRLLETAPAGHPRASRKHERADSAVLGSSFDPSNA